MPTLHELFDAASGDLPPLPDLAPAARRIARRKQLAARTSAAVLGSALVIGAGTFALSVQHSGNARDTASGSPQAYSKQYLLDTLRDIWPNKNQQLGLEDSSPTISVSQDGEEVVWIAFATLGDVAKFPTELDCLIDDHNCVHTTTADGDRVLAETRNAKRMTGAAPSGGPSSLPSAGGSPNLLSREVQVTSQPGDAELIHGYRLHGAYFGELNVVNLNRGQSLTGQQMLGMLESPAYEQLIESAAASSSLGWFGTPPAGIPSATTSYGPSPSYSAN